MSIDLDLIEQTLEASEKQKYIFHYGKSMVISYKLPNGYVINGITYLDDLTEFDEERGWFWCLQDAKDKLAGLVAYEAKQKIAQLETKTKLTWRERLQLVWDILTGK